MFFQGRSDRTPLKLSFKIFHNPYRDFSDACEYFSKQVLLTSTYNDLATKYKEGDGKVKLVDFFKEDQSFFRARKILNEIEHKRELREESRKRIKEEAKCNRSVSAEKEKRGILGKMFFQR